MPPALEAQSSATEPPGKPLDGDFSGTSYSCLGLLFLGSAGLLSNPSMALYAQAPTLTLLDSSPVYKVKLRAFP